MSDAPRCFQPRPRVFELQGEAGRLTLAEALSRLRGRRDPVLLDSAGGAPRELSVLGFDPLPGAAPTSLHELRATCARFAPRAGDARPGGAAGLFFGGFLGALSYDLGVAGEALALPRDPWHLPRIAGGLYCDFLVRDEAAGTTLLVLGEEPGDGRAPVGARREVLQAQLARPHAAAGAVRALGPLQRRVATSEHVARIERARAWIAAGEFYQANLAHPLVRALEGDPVDLYLRLRAHAPTPYAGFLRADEVDGAPRFALLSASPELLLAFDPACTARGTGARARTRPIKGTARRAPEAEADAAAAAALLASGKDLAELAMIVDLERNDLGRVALPGGVRVARFPGLESHPAVHHLVADVEADLRPEVDAFEVLAALFPGGSITGAPKLRSMEAIAELEGEGRGFSFGALGALDPRGAARFNLLIRTLLWRPRPAAGPRAGEVVLRVGGGITWRSNAAAEDDETLAKAAPLLAALEGEGAIAPGMRGSAP